MAIPVTNLSYERVVNQIEQNVMGLQRDIVSNASAHKAMALAQSPALNILQSYITDAINSYLTRLGWITTFQSNPVFHQGLISVLATRPWTEADLNNTVTALTTVVTTLQSAAIPDFPSIVTACNAILSAASVPVSLWPE